MYSYRYVDKKNNRTLNGKYSKNLPLPFALCREHFSLKGLMNQKLSEKFDGFIVTYLTAVFNC